MLHTKIEHTLLAYEYANLYPPPPLIPIEENTCTDNNRPTILDFSHHRSIRDVYKNSTKNETVISSSKSSRHPTNESMDICLAKKRKLDKELDTRTKINTEINSKSCRYSVTPDHECKEPGVKIANENQIQKRSTITQNCPVAFNTWEDQSFLQNCRPLYSKVVF